MAASSGFYSKRRGSREGCLKRSGLGEAEATREAEAAEATREDRVVEKAGRVVGKEISITPMDIEDHSL